MFIVVGERDSLYTRVLCVSSSCPPPSFFGSTIYRHLSWNMCLTMLASCSILRRRGLVAIEEKATDSRSEAAFPSWENRKFTKLDRVTHSKTFQTQTTTENTWITKISCEVLFCNHLVCGPPIALAIFGGLDGGQFSGALQKKCRQEERGRGKERPGYEQIRSWCFEQIGAWHEEGAATVGGP